MANKCAALKDKHIRTGFPSPCGVNIVANNITLITYKLEVILVSVPLRGKYRGEFSEEEYKELELEDSFRPLAG